MWKKIVLGTLLAGLIGVLVAGAIVRTVDKGGNVAEARGLGRGEAQEGLEEGTAPRRGQELDRTSTTGGLGYGGQGRAGTEPNGDGTATGQAEVSEWVTLEGSVVSVDTDKLVTTADGQEILVENRPWLFAQEQGFSTEPGHQVTLVGFYEDAEFKVGQITDMTTGQAVKLRDESGRPLWAGRGRRGG
jgi:hypothetical protein